MTAGAGIFIAGEATAKAMDLSAEAAVTYAISQADTEEEAQSYADLVMSMVEWGVIGLSAVGAYKGVKGKAPALRNTFSKAKISELFGLSRAKKAGATASTSGASVTKNVDNIISEAERKGFRGVRGQIELHTPKGFGRNKDRVINGRSYWGHVLDRMQDRGIPFSVVEDCIKNGKVVPSKKQVCRLEHHDKVNNIRVITDKNTGDVISVIFEGVKK